MEDYQSLTRWQKVKRVLPKVLPLLLLSVILPTADVGTDLALITKLYRGLEAECVQSDGMRRDEEEYDKCNEDPNQYCTIGKVSSNTLCKPTQYYCEFRGGSDGDWKEYYQCQHVGPDQYCTTERELSNKNTICIRGYNVYEYFCINFEIWSSDWKAFKKCQSQGADKYCSDPSSNQHVCPDPTTHPKLANSLLIFFLVNYVMGLVTCLRLEGRKWLPITAALFNVYPQYAALVVIKSLYQNPTRGLRKKSEFEKNIGLSEAFLEAVPTSFIIFLAWNRSYSTPGGDYTVSKILSDQDEAQFWITFSLSVFSATFGLAKCLKNGVAGTFQPGGVLDGLCSVQFLLAFLASGSCTISKGFLIIGLIKRLKFPVLLAATMVFLPSFLVAIISTLDITNKKSLRILISHPYLVLLPTFTFFSYSKLQICGDRRIAFSTKLSIVNTLLNTVVLSGIIIFLAKVQHIYISDIIFLLSEIFLPFFVSALLSILFLWLDEISCCSCCGSAGRLLRVFDPDQPDKTFFMERLVQKKIVELTDSDVEEGEQMEMSGLEEEETLINIVTPHKTFILKKGRVLELTDYDDEQGGQDWRRNLKTGETVRMNSRLCWKLPQSDEE